VKKNLLDPRLISLLLVSLSACGSPRPQSRGAASTAREPLHAAGHNGQQTQPLAVVGEPPDGFADAPAAVFTPQTHPPHGALPPQFVDVRKMPALVVRTNSCFGTVREDSSWNPGYGSGGGGLGRIGSGSGGVRHKSGGASRPAPPMARPPAPSKPRPAPYDPVAGVEDGSYESSAPAAPPPAAAAPAPASPKSEKKDSARDKGGGPRAAAPPQESSAREEGEDHASAREAERAMPEPAPQQDRYHDWGAKLYLSNDDSMSLSSAQRVLYAIDRFLPIPQEHVRPHELLNYFSFDTAPVARTDDFSVHAELQPKPGAAGQFTLGLSVAGRDVTLAERRNGALTFVVDRSGSMSDEGRMNYLKRGLNRMTQELKTGDLVNLVLFDDQVCVPVENFVVGRDPMSVLTGAISRLAPRGSTDVNLGLQKGYALADNAYSSSHNNRVILITDALANTGVTDEAMIALIGKHYDQRRIRLSGVGVGSDFNDSLLDRLTERGKGAYVFLGSEAEVDAVFGARFNSLVETVANDVHFRLHLPPSLGLDVFYGEESSTVKEDVQAIHYFAGTSQMFLSDVSARGGQLRPQDSVMLSVEYENAETGVDQVEEFAFNLGQIAERSRNVQKARLIMSFIDGVRDTTNSNAERREYRAGGWRDSYAADQCARGKQSLADQARVIGDDPEVRRVLKLWDTYCSRYEIVTEPLRQPMHREPPRGADVWPSAQR
jgi:Ca-activated chloride channel homolog